MSEENDPKCENCNVFLKKSKAPRTAGMQVLCYIIVFAGIYAFGLVSPVVGLIIMISAVPVGYKRCWKCPKCKTQLNVS